MSGGGGLQPGNQTTYSRLQGQWSFSLTYTAAGLHLYELQTHWGASVDVLADPQFQWTPSISLSPAQWALSADLLNVQWPTIGPIVIQTFIDGQFQVANGAGQTSIVTGLQIAPLVPVDPSRRSDLVRRHARTGRNLESHRPASHLVGVVVVLTPGAP